MEATHIPTGYEGVPGPTRKQQYRQRAVWELETKITQLKAVLELAYAQEQKQVVAWLRHEIKAFEQLLVVAREKLRTLK